MNLFTKANPFGLTLMLFSLLIIYSSCDNCSDVACFTPPQPFIFNFVDSTGVNVFETGTYSINDLELTDNKTGDRISYDIIEDQFLRIHSIGWESEEIDYSFSLKNLDNINFTVNAERLPGKCCNFTRMTDFNVSSHDFIVSDETDIITITL